MRARRNSPGTSGRGRKVYIPDPPSYAYEKPEEVISTPMAEPPQVKVPPLCPHGGAYILGNILVCGECAKAEGRDTRQLLGIALMDIARRAAYSVPVKTANIQERQAVALAELVVPKNIFAISTARKPVAMAHKIAVRAIMRLYREQIPMAVSQYKFRGSETVDNRNVDPSDFQRVQWLQAQYDAPDCNTPNTFPGYLDSIRIFPGIDLLFTQENLEWLRQVIDAAKEELPTEPYSVWYVIDLRLGLSEGMHEHTWDEISKMVSRPWKPVTIRQVTHAYQQGLKTMGAYISSYLYSFNPIERSSDEIGSSETRGYDMPPQRL